MAHGDAVGDGDGAEFARRAAGLLDALLGRLGLAHQGDVAGRGFVPAAGDADEGLVDLLLGQPHGVIIGAMRRAAGTFGDVAGGQPGFVESWTMEALIRERRRTMALAVASRSSRFFAGPCPAGKSAIPAKKARRQGLRDLVKISADISDSGDGRRDRCNRNRVRAGVRCRLQSSLRAIALPAKPPATPPTTAPDHAVGGQAADQGAAAGAERGPGIVGMAAAIVGRGGDGTGAQRDSAGGGDFRKAFHCRSSLASCLKPEHKEETCCRLAFVPVGMNGQIVARFRPVPPRAPDSRHSRDAPPE